ncbi:hypothetical protein GQ44DRAFT_822063 [Phaeosphaeriaceae sp. PMI808]|nr:hypothetical protein GQ44DRAFT_822063 [Phaeosphaeriaceae sp. PMI808]
MPEVTVIAHNELEIEAHVSYSSNGSIAVDIYQRQQAVSEGNILLVATAFTNNASDSNVNYGEWVGHRHPRLPGNPGLSPIARPSRNLPITLHPRLGSDFRLSRLPRSNGIWDLRRAAQPQTESETDSSATSTPSTSPLTYEEATADQQL